ncbi:hypothetical protein [Salinispira pacifica]|uniref:hypothetical protein n=1 Tax=Salinispira pacifica TaxID=1307761 RepID=UPI0011845A79|nr:hypothetical protein [Salinispira pacifica]
MPESVPPVFPLPEPAFADFSACEALAASFSAASACIPLAFPDTLPFPDAAAFISAFFSAFISEPAFAFLAASEESRNFSPALPATAFSF